MPPPGQVRKAISEKRMRATQPDSVPGTPFSWSDLRRKRMEIAIRAAHLFLVRRQRWRAILETLAKEFPGLVKEDCTRARVQQYVSRGCAYMLKVKYIVSNPPGFFR